MKRSVGRRARARALALIEQHPKGTTLLARLDQDGPHGQPQAFFTNGQVSGWVRILTRLEDNIKNRKKDT